VGTCSQRLFIVCVLTSQENVGKMSSKLKKAVCRNRLLFSLLTGKIFSLLLITTLHAKAIAW